MNVLLAFNEDLNPYVERVCAGMEGQDVTLTCSTTPFWEGKATSYDVVHIQWPETLFDWHVPTTRELLFLEQRLQELKGKVPVVHTFHNRASHHLTDENRPRLQKLFELVETAATTVIHLGPVTAEQDRDRFPNATKHVIIPIPIYETPYEEFVALPQHKAREQLSLKAHTPLVLAFGNLRTPEERTLVQEASAMLSQRGIKLYAPKWFKPGEQGYSPLHPFWCLRSLNRLKEARKLGLIPGSFRHMSDPQVAACFAAADAILLPRIDDINSGNLPMGYLFGKPVVGPNIGNMGYWLTETNNPVFDPSDGQSLRKALNQCADAMSSSLGDSNHAFAKETWSTASIGVQHARLYQELTEERTTPGTTL